MIRLLTDPFCIQVPDTIEEYLEHGVAQCIAFNRRGTLLAAGCESGEVVLWDFETRGVARVLCGGHAANVAAVAWSHNGRRVVSAGADGALNVWDVLTGEAVATAKLASKPVSVQPHPKSPHLLLVCCAGAPAALLDTRSGALTTLPFGVPAADAAAVAAPAGRKGASAPASAAPAATSSVALFSRGGQDAIVFVGSNVGTLAAVALSSDPAAAPSLRECVRLGSAAGGAGAGVRSLCLSRRGGVLLAVCADRVLRALDVSRPSQALRPLREFRDAVNKTAWRAGALSADGAYVAAASGSASEHTLHVWCRDSGTLQCVLEGPSAAGAPAALAWHPSAPLLASLGGTGRVYVWARAAAENWSAFAPDFRELEENEEYVEREDEFDAPVAGSGVGGAVRAEAAQGQSAAAGAAAAAGGDDDDTVVDVLTLDAATALGGDSDSDSDDEGALHHLPLVPELDAAPPAAEAAAAVAGEPDAAEADAVAGEEGGEEGGAKGGDDEDAAQPASKKARARA